MSDKFNQEFELKVYKSRIVKSPAKAWDAAGWDFYVPENLSIFDFAESYKAYLDDNVKYDKNYVYYVPIVFYMKSNRTVGEFLAQLTLAWNEVTQQWRFGIIDYTDSKKTLNPLDDADNKIVKWLTEDETVISRFEILPHGSINIPSGIHVNLPENIFLQASNKSGISSKRRLSYLACVTAETIIETNKGKFTVQTLTKEFCEKNEILIKTYNYVTKSFEFRKCDGFRCTGEKDCVKVKFDNNSELEGSFDHCIFDEDEEKWNSLENL